MKKRENQNRETFKCSWGKLFCWVSCLNCKWDNLINPQVTSIVFLPFANTTKEFPVVKFKNNRPGYLVLSTLFPSAKRTLPTTMQAIYTEEATTLATITGKSHLLIAGMKRWINVSAARRNLKHGPKLAHLKTTMSFDFSSYRMEDRIKKHCLPLQEGSLKCCLTARLVQNSCVCCKFMPFTPVQEKCNCRG